MQLRKEEYLQVRLGGHLRYNFFYKYLRGCSYITLYWLMRGAGEGGGSSDFVMWFGFIIIHFVAVLKKCCKYAFFIGI